MDEATNSASLEQVLNESTGLVWGPSSLLVVSFDQSLRVVSCVFAADGQPPRGLFTPGTPLADLFPDAPLQSIVAPHIAAALIGEAGEVDVAWEDPERLRLRLSFLPRFQGPGRRRGHVLTARHMADVERQSRQADALRGRLTAILDNAADAILLIDQQGVIQDANEAVTRLFRWSPADLIGRPVSVLMDTPHEESHQAYVDRYLQTGVSGILNVGPRKLPARRRGGDRVWIELSVGEAWIAGERTFVGVCRDIGDRLVQEEALRRANVALEETVFDLRRVTADLESQKRRSEDLVRAAEAARQRAVDANEAKSRFLATVSHELRTPLNGVLAVADLLAAQPLPPGAGGLVDIIRQSGQDLLGLLNEVLDLSQVEAGALTIAAEPFAPKELLRSTAAIWKPAAEAKGIDFQVALGDLPAVAIGDAGRLRQVVSNLLSNAIKFTDRGQVRLSARAVEHGGALTLTIVVSDTGPSIESSMRGRIFEPFSRGRSREMQRHDAGLGLAISREIIGLMRGSIFADENPGGGARMVVELDLPTSNMAAIAPQAESPRPDLGGLRKVLVAEDHPVNRQVMGLLLSELGLDCVMTEDGVAAVAAAEAERFDVILMDIRMPRMDGLAATRAIRAGRGPNAATPVIAVTADAMPGDEAPLLAAGIDAILPKPISLEGLAAALEFALSEPV
jgi:PAS domain S-box-containing protein